MDLDMMGSAIPAFETFPENRFYLPACLSLLYRRCHSVIKKESLCECRLRFLIGA